MKRLLLVALTMGCFSSYAQINIEQLEVSAGSHSSQPMNLYYDGSTLFFYAEDSAGGADRELWKVENDGTPVMVADLNTSGEGDGQNERNFRQMASFGGKLYFAGDDGGGRELFEYDGTNAPKKLTSFSSGGNNTHSPRFLTPYGGKLYYSGNDATVGRELFEYDPSTGTSKSVTDINPGDENANVQYITIFKNKLYFSADDSTNGEELWSFDPSNNTANLVKNVDSGWYNAYPHSMIVYNNKLYYACDETGFGHELFVYDGTSEPTRVLDLKTTGGFNQDSGLPTENSELTQSLIEYFGSIYMCARNDSSRYELFSYHPGTNSVKLVHEFNSNNSGNGGNAYPYYFEIYNGDLYMAATDGTGGFGGNYQIYKYNGPSDQVTMVGQINTSGSSRPREFTRTKKYLYFAANNGTDGEELYRLYDSTLSIQKVSFDADVKVYPNPATNVINVELKLKSNHALSLNIIDIAGRTVYTSENKAYNAGTHTIQVPAANLTPGQYIYNITDKSGSTMNSGSIIKQ